jgi:hypothetical protein
LRISDCRLQIYKSSDLHNPQSEIRNPQFLEVVFSGFDDRVRDSTARGHRVHRRVLHITPQHCHHRAKLIAFRHRCERCLRVMLDSLN